MQKVVKVELKYNFDINELNIKYLNNGWNIVESFPFNQQKEKNDPDFIVFILEKIGRKEKLENLDNLNN